MSLVAVDDRVVNYLDAHRVSQFVRDLGAHSSDHIYRYAIFLISRRRILDLLFAQMEFCDILGYDLSGALHG